MVIAQGLPELIAAEARQPVSAAGRAVSDAIAARYGEPLVATIFYGSCLRPEVATANAVGPGSEDERILDFYAVVEDLVAANGSGLRALGNRLLPPNVFYLEVPLGDRVVRCKYAILSLTQLERLTDAATLQNYFWGRFCQPTAIPFARSAALRSRVEIALAQACVSMLSATVPLMDGPFDARSLWIAAFIESYRAELRVEDAPGRAALLHDSDPVRYAQVASLVVPACCPDVRQDAGAWCYVGPGSGAARRAWRLRRLIGKSLNAARVVKAGFTFDDGLDYLLWKIERHSGVRVPVGPWERRHPILCAPVLGWRAWRAGAFR